MGVGAGRNDDLVLPAGSTVITAPPLAPAVPRRRRETDAVVEQVAAAVPPPHPRRPRRRTARSPRPARRRQPGCRPCRRGATVVLDASTVSPGRAAPHGEELVHVHAADHAQPGGPLITTEEKAAGHMSAKLPSRDDEDAGPGHPRGRRGGGCDGHAGEPGCRRAEHPLRAEHAGPGGSQRDPAAVGAAHPRRADRRRRRAVQQAEMRSRILPAVPPDDPRRPPGDVWFVWYEHGGIAYFWQAVVARVTSGGDDVTTLANAGTISDTLCTLTDGVYAGRRRPTPTAPGPPRATGRQPHLPVGRETDTLGR